MKENKNLELLHYHDEEANENSTLSIKDGIPILKGAVLTEEYLIKNQKNLERIMNFFSAYPDLYLDIITPSDSEFSLFFYQRIMLRAIMRYKEIYVTAPRAFSKSFISILGMMLQCIFIPKTRRFICAPNKNQAAQIAKEKIIEIYDRFPLIMKEVRGSEITNTPGNFGKDYVSLTFRNGSTFEVVGAIESTRGNRKFGGLIDEVRDQDEKLISEVVLPLLNVSRRLPDNTVNPKEVNQQTIFMTSAGTKASYAYVKLIDTLENSIIDPHNSFFMGCDYRIPILHGLLDKNYVNKLKMSPSYNTESFAREYLSLWQGGADDSYYSFDMLSRHRKLKNPESHEICRGNTNQFYLLSTDVGRFSDQTVCTVFKVTIGPSTGKYNCSVVNIYVLGRDQNSKTFYRQAIDLKQIIRNFKPKEVVIDTNGLGVGLADEMIRQQVDEKGEIYPPYGFFNDEKYKKIQPKDCLEILYGIKANANLNSEIHSNAYTRISNGSVSFLISEQEAKSLLLGTKKGQQMSIEQRIKRLMPHEMTTSLFNEMTNLRLKKGSDVSKIVLERINSRFPKDKYSSLSYGLWRIKEIEEITLKNKRRKNFGKRQLVFFSSGG